ASFVILILFEPLKTKVEEKVLSIFFAERFQFVQALAALRQRMAGIIDVRELAQVVLDGFYETRRVTHGSIYLLADDGLGFRRRVAIPLIASQRVVCVLCVLDDGVSEVVAADDVATMLDIGEQAAITIENSRLYEKMKERDRLAALGEMAAGLAHEIRNPLGA